MSEITVIDQKLTKGGQRALIKIGNTVIDILHGYNNSHDIPCAIIDVYPYSDSEYRVLVRNKKGGIVYSV